MLDLADLFKMQDTFNQRVGLPTKKFADVFGANPDKVNVQQTKVEAGIWIDDLLKAMSSEMEELRGCTLWKHWCSEAQAGRRYEVKDIEAARKEVVDMFHFWIAMAQALGMTAEMTCGMYGNKLDKNIKRQDDGYSIILKDKAWDLFKTYPDSNPFPGSFTAESLEDLPDDVGRFYVEWAKNVTPNWKDS
jgi:hypothetical protein